MAHMPVVDFKQQRNYSYAILKFQEFVVVLVMIKVNAKVRSGYHLVYK